MSATMGQISMVEPLLVWDAFLMIPGMKMQQMVFLIMPGHSFTVRPVKRRE